jgi:hypothetical protein
MMLAQAAQFFQLNVLGSNETIKDTGGTGRALTAPTTLSGLALIAGTGSSAATVLDYSLQTAVAGSSGTCTPSVGAYSGSGTSGSFSVTGTITNSSGSTIDYQEFGLTVSDGTHTYLLTHDVLASSIAVPNLQVIGFVIPLTWD